jgi:DNA ligase-associated metallophosphoesterase
MLFADPEGALYWPEERVLIVADLHLEKGSSFARRGVLLPPFDTAATLARLARLVSRYAPRVVIALGDSFHDEDGPARIVATDLVALTALQRGRDWIWIAGNHDPRIAANVGGRFVETLSLGTLTFVHKPSFSGPTGEICGHLHPVARINRRGRSICRRCFATDARRMVMPAFGAYTGGLNIRNPAFASVFEAYAFMAHLLGQGRLYAVAASRCLGG